MTVISIVDGYVKVSKGLEKGLDELKIRGRIDTIQTTTLLGSAGITRRVLETLNFSERPPANSIGKNTQGV